MGMSSRTLRTEMQTSSSFLGSHSHCKMSKSRTSAHYIPEMFLSHQDNGGQKCSFEFPKFSIGGSIVPTENSAIGSWLSLSGLGYKIVTMVDTEEHWRELDKTPTRGSSLCQHRPGCIIGWRLQQRSRKKGMSQALSFTAGVGKKRRKATKIAAGINHQKKIIWGDWE